MAVVLAAPLIACGDDDVDLQGPDEWDHPSGAQVVVQVREEGGLRPQGASFTEVPGATLLGDGRLVVVGPQRAIHPPPALPPLLSKHVGEAGITSALDAAERLGLLEGPLEFGRPSVADATTTVVEIHAAGRDLRHEVYASGAGADGAGLSSAHLARREQIAHFIRLVAAPELSPEQPSRTYEADGFAIRAHRVPDQQEGQPVAGAGPSVSRWPLEEVSLADAATCIDIGGRDADALRPLLRSATAITHFAEDGVRYTLDVRPLLPNEGGCGDLG